MSRWLITLLRYKNTAKYYYYYKNTAHYKALNITCSCRPSWFYLLLLKLPSHKSHRHKRLGVSTFSCEILAYLTLTVLYSVGNCHGMMSVGSVCSNGTIARVLISFSGIALLLFTIVLSNGSIVLCGFSFPFSFPPGAEKSR